MRVFKSVLGYLVQPLRLLILNLLRSPLCRLHQTHLPGNSTPEGQIQLRTELLQKNTVGRIVANVALGVDLVEGKLVGG